MKKLFFTSAILMALMAGSVFAQNQRARISGTVTDSNGSVVSGAKVTLFEVSLGKRSAVVTDTSGGFVFKDLLDGEYRITVSYPNFADAAKTIKVSGGDASVQIQLAVSGVAAIVNVDAETARVELERVPGGTDLVARRQIQQTAGNNMKDVLNFTPGVLAQPRFGSDEMQISVRGSGLRNNYHLRGVNILVNGMPYGDADGFSDFESLEFLTANRVEVWKGANALRYGGNTAGGAINLVTETSETAFPLELRIQGGSFGSFKGYLSTGGERGRFGYFVGVSDSELDGYREHSAQGRRRLFGNFTFKYNETTDFFADVMFANFAEIYPGSLTYAEFQSDPQQANPENVSANWGRFANYYRGAVGMKKRYGRRHEFSFKVSAQYRDLIHPIFNFLDQDTRTYGGEFRYAYTGLKNRFVIGFAPQSTWTAGRRFDNNFGVQGEQAAHFDSLATNYGIYFENQYDITSNFTLVTGGRVDFSKRRLTDLFLSDGNQSDKRTYNSFTPKVGFVFRAKENAQIFANVSRSYEPPLLLELTSFGFVSGFLPLEAQDTWQVEVGTRGSILSKRLNYEVAFYNSAISNEVLNQNLQPFPNAPFTIPSFRSVPKTRHSGFELSTDAVLANDLFTENARLSWRTAYTFANFKFTEDAAFTDNFIPGQPKHLVRSELRYIHPKGFWIAPGIDWSPASYFVNSSNTAKNDSYADLNLRVGFDRKSFGVFLDANNLFDRNYAGSVQVDDGAGRYYEPSNGRGATVGFVYRLGRR
ncbi:MAG: TonB-dependent receptor [Chloracidobacterium sp.]|nr:TonB-dependent receptor [Chloracidobacterium sp.]